MSKEQKITNNIKVPNKDLETLKIHFPHCFDKDGNFQFEKFKNNLTEKEINFSTESYGLDWLGKSYARLLASDPATTLLCQVLKKVYTFYINTKIRLQFKYNSKIYLQPPFFCNNFSIYNLPF